MYLSNASFRYRGCICRNEIIRCIIKPYGSLFLSKRKVNEERNCYLFIEFLEKKLSINCQKFCIPNLVTLGKGIHQFQNIGKLESQYYFYADTLLEEAYHQKFETLEETLTYVQSYVKPISEVQKMWEDEILRIEKKEKEWSICISDYIKENYQKIPLFCDSNHPSLYLVNEINRRIAKKLGLEVEEIEFEAQNVDGAGSFVWECVRKGLALEWDNPKEMKKSHMKAGQQSKTGYTIEEFITYYLYAWHKHIFRKK